MSKRYFYGRVSAKDQNLARQIESAKQYKNIDHVFKDKQSGKDFNRDDYQKMKEILEPGDEVVVHALDRLGRNKDGIKEELAWFKEHGVIVRILNVPTTLIEYPEGQEWLMDMVNNILIEVLASYAEQERVEIKLRQAEGIAAKKASGNWDDYGRPSKEIPDFEKFLKKQKDGELSVVECCKALGISRATWYNRLKEVV